MGLRIPNPATAQKSDSSLMDWFKQNPFLGSLAFATVLFVIASGYYAYTTHSEFVLQTEEYSVKTSAVAQARGTKPFPNQTNLEAAQAEKAEAEKIIGEMNALLSQKSGKVDQSLNPQAFQDRLNAQVSKIEKAARSAQVELPENFYLGFDEYRNQLPSATAAPLLGQQLDSISSVITILVEAGVKAINAVRRQPLSVESAKQDTTDKPEKNPNNLILAPFEVSFVADQTNFRLALNKIVTADPIIFVRLVSVANSQQSPPAKQNGMNSDPQSNADQPSAETSIPVLLGKETLNVDLRLATISADNTSDKK
jgi:hypothetical protein